jgi:glycosyltransferase involved in cell wall biosynthesis
MLNDNGKDDRRTAIVIGMPWPRGGTAKVMEMQIRYLRSRGLRTVFVAVPHNPGQKRSHDVWSGFAALTDELRADDAIIATFGHRIRKWGKFGRWCRAQMGVNAMHWSMHAAAVSPIPAELDHELLSGRVQTLIVNHVYAIEFGLRVKERLKKLGQFVPIILVTHDVQSHILIDNDSRNPFTGKFDSLDTLLATEVAALKNADVLVHVSDDDKRFFETAIPDRPHVLALPTCEDRSHIEHPFPPEGRRDLLFVGSYHVGNYHALDWFFSMVKPWLGADPLSLQILGNVDWLVHERDPKLYSRISQYLVGSTADVLPYYLMSNCVIIPMVGGRGVSIKTVEAAAIGCPMVGTRFAFRGLPADAVKAAGVRVCDDPREFATEILRTLQSPQSRKEASCKLFKSLFSYSRFESAMNEALMGTLAPARANPIGMREQAA